MTSLIHTSVALVDGWVYIKLINPPPYWRLRGRYRATLADGSTAWGEWFDAAQGTGDLVQVQVNTQSASAMEWQIIATDPPEVPVEPPPPEIPE